MAQLVPKLITVPFFGTHQYSVHKSIYPVFKSCSGEMIIPAHALSSRCKYCGVPSIDPRCKSCGASK